MIEFSDFNMILILAIGVSIGNLMSFGLIAIFGAFIELRKKRKA